MATGFLTDTTVCIGCKACEVACKQWNQLPADGYELSGDHGAEEPEKAGQRGDSHHPPELEDE